ncbi:MAG: SulP family inorganic anion transporter, partial [bacterium]|nr:SulP family inorganic anion transporter [bacterium]
ELNIDIAATPTLVSTALVIAILGFMESFSIAKSLAIKSGEKIDANQEFIGQGLANIASASVQGYPVSGSFSRSAVNYKAGGQTGLSSVITGLCVLVTLLFFTPFLYHLPQSVLSAIIITSVINLINLDKIKETYKIIRSDGFIAIFTFITTLIYAPHLDKGLIVGVTISIGYYIYTRTKPHIVQLSANKSGTIIETATINTRTCKHIAMIRFDGSLFFGNATYLNNQIASLLSSKNKQSKYLVFDAHGVNFIDTSGIEALTTLNEELLEIGVKILFVGIKQDILVIIKRTELYSKIKNNIYDSRHLAVSYAYKSAHYQSSETNCPLSSLINN